MALAATPVEQSLGTWAAALGVTRDVLRRVLADAGVQPSGKKSGHPAYALRDVLEAWISNITGGAPDPDSLRPMERKLHYQAEHEKLRLQVERGELVPSIEVERGHGLIFAIVAQCFDTLPDVLERDVGLNSLQLTRAERHLDEAREALYQKLIEGDEDDGADSAAADRA